MRMGLHLPTSASTRSEETDAQYKERSISTLNSYLRSASAEREANYFHEAARVFFARIIKSEEIKVGGTPYARRIVLRPLQAIKGTLPAGTFMLRDRELTSCGVGGDGPGTWGGISHIAIVFEGVRNQGMTYRSSRYVVLASEASEPTLVKAWTGWKAAADFTFDE